MRKAKQKKCECGIENFEWSGFSSERERIKHNTELTKGLTIAESFAKVYNIKLKRGAIDESVNDYKELNVGDTVALRILNIDRRGVVFDNGPYKEDIVSEVNLYRYTNFRTFIPKDPVECVVVRKERDKVYVDPINTLYTKWIKDHTENLQLQYDMTECKPTKICNLHRVRGGFTGSVEIDTVSKFLGDKVYMEAFIPGSQIVLNIEDDFDAWEGKDTEGFITNYSEHHNGMSLICSRKQLLQFKGQQVLIEMFKHYTEEDKDWETISTTPFDGKITGIINSATKCGVFVEIPQICVTGMIPMDADMLTSYKKDDDIKVCIADFDEQKRYNPDADQMQKIEPYVITTYNNGHRILEKFALKPILKMA